MKECTIIINDEVNCKISGLDLTTRKKLVKEFKYMLPHARHTPAFKMGRWDGMVSFFQLGGRTYINLLPDIIPILDSEKYNIKLQDNRDYPFSFDLDLVSEESYSHIKWPEKHQMAGEPIMLRDYQVGAINEFLKNPQSISDISTAAGKTIITAVLSQSVEKYGRSIVIVPNKSLVTQTEADYANMQLDVGVFFGDQKDYGKTHTICTWQSLNSLLKQTKEGRADISIHEFLEDVVCVIVDETHQVKATVLQELLTGIMAKIPIRWGLTGTIPKEVHEYQALRTSIGDVINKISASELQDKGVLSKCHVSVMQMVDSVVHPTYQQELKYLVTSTDRVNYIANTIESIAKDGNTLVLVDRISTGEHIESCIPGSVFVRGATKNDDRKAHYDGINESDNGILIATYAVAAVGVNIPRIFNVVMIEPGKSFVRVIQTIGRGIRKAKDKDFVQIYDITSTCKFSKRHLTKRKAFYREAKYPFTVSKLQWQ